MSMKNSSDTIRNQTRDLPACSAVPQPTALPCTDVIECNDGCQVFRNHYIEHVKFIRPRLIMNMPQVNLLAFAMFRRKHDRKLITVSFVSVC